MYYMVIIVSAQQRQPTSSWFSETEKRVKREYWVLSMDQDTTQYSRVSVDQDNNVCVCVCVLKTKNQQETKSAMAFVGFVYLVM